jgi:uncharacterized protein (TIGR00288 family)
MANTGAIFFDFENVRIRLGNFNPTIDAFKIDIIEKIKKTIIDKGIVISHAYVYDNYETKYLFDNSFMTKLSAIGFSPKHTLSTNGIKNSADIEMCLDAYEICLTSNVETFIIVSSDKDMFPLIKKLKANLKKVILIGVTFNTSNYIIKYVDEFVPLESLVGVNYDKDFVIKQDVIIATRRLNDLCDWVINRNQPGLGKEFFIEKLKLVLYSNTNDALMILDKMLENDIAELHTYNLCGNNKDGIRILKSQTTIDILDNKIPNLK